MNIENEGLNISAAPRNTGVNFKGYASNTFRRKDPREAADAGLLLWRRNFAAFLPFFAVPFWIFAFFLRIILPGSLQYLSWLIIWLCKPLFDRLILHVISMRFFETDAGYKRLRKGMAKTIFRGLAGDLLWRRFSPLRSVMMPVRVLERNIKTAKVISQRKKNLEKGGIGFGFLLTVWGIAAEVTLLFGEVFFFSTIMQFIAQDFLYSIESFADVEIYFFAAWCLNFILIETIYICMGFSLYINSRIETEGWDLEITFRDFAQCAEKFKNGLKNTALIILLSVCLFLPAKTFADDADQAMPDVPLETLKAILDSPDYGSVEESWGIRFKNQQERQREEIEFDSDLLLRIKQIFAYTLRFILICVIAFLLALLFIYLRKIQLNRNVTSDNYSENILLSSHEEDPALLLEKAVNFHKRGETRLAWGYCAAAAIQSWSIYCGIKFPADAAENDCVNLVIEKSNNSRQAADFGKYIKMWIYFAYAGRLPPEGSFEEAVNYCITLRTQNG